MSDKPFYYNCEDMVFAVSDLAELPYRVVRTMLVPRLIPVGGNEEMLVEIPHFRIKDMALTYEVEFMQKGDLRRIMMKVSNRYLRAWNVSPEMLHKDAMESGADRHPAKLYRMEDCLLEPLPIRILAPDGIPELFVATVEGSLFGAAVILYPGFLEKAAIAMGGDYYILPSSVHEMLLLRAGEGYDTEELEALVRFVNENTVIPPERLSNRVLKYSDICGVFPGKIIEKYRNEWPA